MSQIINTSIILDDAFQGHITVNAKTGDKWVNITTLQGSQFYRNANKNTTELKVSIADRKEIGKYGDTHTVSLQQSQEQKGQPKVYVGSAKAFNFSSAGNPAAAAPAAPKELPTADDLPF